MEQKATDRVNNAIAMLRNDLIEMRTQDVKLMKQLLNINLVIQKMTNERLCQSMRPSSQGRHKQKPTRQQSLPPFLCVHRETIYSTSSSEEFSEDISDYSDNEDNEEEIFSKSNGFAIRNRISSILPLSDEDGDDSSDEEILRTNIKLWKHSHTLDND